VEHVVDEVDLMNIMTVNPGFAGQSFIESMRGKIAAAKALIGDRPVRVEVDGGINESTAPMVIQAGADVLVAGAAIFCGAEAVEIREVKRPYGEIKNEKRRFNQSSGVSDCGSRCSHASGRAVH